MSLINLARRVIGSPQIWSRFAAIGSAHREKFSLVRYQSSNVNDDVNKKLMEFFDDKKNWGENEVKHGRNWETTELRIKSNQDLHKLWFVLMKEKNMLLTMENEGIEEHRLFPSPERLDKVTKSMENIETVVRERNRAFHELETGETGERPGKLVKSQLGLSYFYRSAEHVIPYHFNTKWRESRKHSYRGHAVKKFLRFYREKLWNEKRKKLNRDRNEVVHLLKRNPELDRNMLRQKFPTVDIDKLAKRDAFRGHHVPKL